MVSVTTQGLRPNGTSVSDIPDVAWAIAGGLADAITATYEDPNTALSDGLILGFRAALANATATPTFAPDGLAAHTIVKGGGLALAPGDIPGLGAECLVRYNLANTRWELLNPYVSMLPARNWAIAGGTVDAITGDYDPNIVSLTDGLILGFRASGANTSTTPTFSPDGLTARTIVAVGGQALNAGDIPRANAEMLVRYNLANTRWELLNPAIQTAIDADRSAKLFYKWLNADDTGGQNVATAQPWFPSAGGVTLAAGVYEFEGELVLSRSAGSTSHTTSLLFGGTAAVTSIDYFVTAMSGDANSIVSGSAFSIHGNATTATVVKVASVSTTEQIVVRIRGIVRIGTAGTLIPQFQYSAAPGGAPTVKRGTNFSARYLGAASFVTNGTWS